MIDHYGYPPEVGECRTADPPESLITAVDQRVLKPVVDTGMAPGGLGRKVPVSGIARQLCSEFEWGSQGPVAVTVPRYGTFLIGPLGWALVDRL